MRTPYDPIPLKLTDADRAEWRRYEKANAASIVAYSEKPFAFPRVELHYRCMCCDILTAQSTMVCLSCQARSEEWRALAHDPETLMRTKRMRQRRATLDGAA